jgi:predicted lipoprotein with Yx(FWY)xxD motif
MKIVIRGALVCLAAAFAVLAGGCGAGGSGGAGTENNNNNNGGVNVATRSSASLGNYLVSGDGRTLYYFGLDLPAAGEHAPVSNCTGSCVPLWPIFHLDTPVVASGLNAADFGEFVRSDGVKQTTYKGWPLYFYAGDAKAGDTNGDNFEVWYVIKDPFYSVLAMTKTGGPALYLADPAGRTLYIDARDTVGAAPSCTGACLNNWLVFAAGSGPLPTGIDASKLTTFTRPDGVAQSAFDGHPLYYFVRDVAPGDTNGRGGLQGAFDVFDPSTL